MVLGIDPNTNFVYSLRKPADGQVFLRSFLIRKGQ